MQAPERIQPKILADYLEMMSKAVFQSGISWQVVDKKWPEIKEAMHGFDPETLSDLSEPDMESLTRDRRVIRNRRKLEAIASNAQRILELDETHGSFRGYLRSHGGFEETAKDLRKQFKFLGDHGTYYFLWTVGEDVPPYEEWCASRGVPARAHGG